MFTVILYYNKRQKRNLQSDQPYLLFLQEYEFLFTYEQLQNRLILLPYEPCETGEGNINKVLNNLNHYVRDLSEWKLLLFDGRQPNVEEEPNVHPNTIRQEWIEILEVFSGGGKKAKQKGFSGAAPYEIWYLSCWNKGKYVTDIKSFQYSIAQEEDGSNILDRLELLSLRMCWVEIEDDTVMVCQHEQLRVSCLLLILAYNDIPCTFVDGGYLYRVDAALERKEFAAYIMRRQQMNTELRKQLERAEEKAYQERQQTISYDTDAVFSELLIYNYSSIQDKKDYQKLEFKEMDSRRQHNLDVILNKNRAWAMKRLYDFRDTLHTYVTQNVSLPEQYVDNCLDTAGQEILRKEKNVALFNLCQDREDSDNPRKREKELYKREEEIYRLEDQTLSRGDRVILIVWSSLIIVGAFVGPIWSRGKKLLELYPKSLLFFAPVVLLFVLILHLGGWATRKRCYRNYNFFLENTIKKEHKKREENVKNIISSIRRYQYYHALEQKQSFIRSALEQEQKKLIHHKVVLKNAEDSCRRMEQMLGQDEILEKVPVIVNNIDFGQEPEDVESYWNLPMDTSAKRDLNNSGYKINAVFPFISNITLHKTPSLKSIWVSLQTNGAKEKSDSSSCQALMDGCLDGENRESNL